MPLTTIDNKVKQVVSNIRNLPTPPIVFHQIQKVINSPNASAAQVAAILSEDPAMSVKVLKLTNSAFYGLARAVESVKQAVIIVGMEAVKNLVLSASVLEMFKCEHVDEDYQEKFWRHSLATAFCSRLLARSIKSRGNVDPDAAFSCGLLHDIGKIVICCFLPQEYLKFNEARIRDKNIPTWEVEEKSLGFNHCQVGCFLTQHWKLPAKVSDAIAYHHHPRVCPSDDSTPYIVYLANYLAKKTFYEPEDQHLIGSLDYAVLEHLQVDDSRLLSFGEELKEAYTKAETFIKMAGLG